MPPKQLEGFTYTPVRQDPNQYFRQLVAQKYNKKGTGKLGKSGLSAWISEAAGSGGALGGAAAGAALGSVVPGIGNVVGGVLGGIAGGFAGGFSGRAVENKLRDNEYRLGDALKEGAISGAFGGVGPAFQGARGLGVLGKAAGGKGIGAGAKALSGLGDDAAKIAVGKAISKGGAKAAQSALYGGAKTNALQVAGRNLAGNAQGVGIGSKAPGLATTLPGAQDEILKALKTVGLSSSNPESTLRGLEPILSTKGVAISNAYKNSGKLFTKTQLNNVADDIIKQVLDDPAIELSKSAQNGLLKQLTLLTKQTNPESLWNYQTKLGKSINFGKGAEAKLVDREAVARIIRDSTAKLLDKSVKEVATDRALYGTLSDAKKLMGVASKQADKSGIATRLMTSAPARRAEAALGGALESTGDAIASPMVTGSAKLARGASARGVTGNIVNPSAAAPQDPAQYDQALNELGMTADMGGGQDMTQQMQQPQAELYPAQNMMQDIQNDFQATGGKNVDKYLSLYKALSAVTASQNKASGLNVTKPTSEKLSNAQSGMDSVGQLRQILANNPELVGKSSVPGRGLPVVGGLVSKALGTTDYDAQAYNMMDNLLRIRTGAQANPTEIKKYVTSLLPRLGDSPAEAERKLQIFEKQFGDILQLAGAPNQGGQESYLQDAILNSGGSM